MAQQRSSSCRRSAGPTSRSGFLCAVLGGSIAPASLADADEGRRGKVWAARLPNFAKTGFVLRTTRQKTDGPARSCSSAAYPAARERRRVVAREGGRWASGAVTGAVGVGAGHAVEEAGVAPGAAGATVGAAAAALAVEEAAVARPAVEEPPAVAAGATRKP